MCLLKVSSLLWLSRKWGVPILVTECVRFWTKCDQMCTRESISVGTPAFRCVLSWSACASKLVTLQNDQFRWIRLFVRFSLQVAFLWKTCHHFWRMIAETFSANIRLTSPMFLWSTLITLWSNHSHFGTKFKSSCFWLNHNTLVTISCAVSLSRQNMVKCVF